MWAAFGHPATYWTSAARRTSSRKWRLRSGAQIDPAASEVARELELHLGKIQERRPGRTLELHEQIDVAVRARRALELQSEQRQPADAMPLAEILERMRIDIEACVHLAMLRKGGLQVSMTWALQQRAEGLNHVTGTGRSPSCLRWLLAHRRRTTCRRAVRPDPRRLQRPPC